MKSFSFRPYAGAAAAACILLLSACGNGAIPEKPGARGASSTPGGFTPAPGSSLSTTPSSAVVTTPSGQSVTAVASSGSLVRAQSLATPASAPTGFSYPMGFFAFDISGLTPGAQITLTLTLPAGSAPVAYVKCISNLCAPFSGATIGGNQIQLLLTDGGAGDSDGIANGVIRDPGGPAFTTTVNPPVTTQCSDGLDNDNDGKIDFGGQNPDPGCGSASDDDETDPVTVGCPLQPGTQVLTSWTGSVQPSVIGLFGDSHTFSVRSDCPITSMTVQISWQPQTPVNLEDLDLTLTPPEGAAAIPAAQETNFFGEAQETILVANPVGGEYTADVSGFVSLATAYSGRVTVFVASTNPACSDGIDNDGDGKIDFGGANGDPGCDSTGDNSEIDPPPPPQCSDGLDNDGDGKIDFGGASGDPGCDSATDNDEADVVVPQSAPRVVVADIDSAINPYHIFYNACTTYIAGPNPGRACSPIYPEGSPPASVTPEVLDAFGIDEAHRITLTRTGDFAADLAADQAIWDEINDREKNPDGELYWFVGTNIIAAAFDPTGPRILPDDESDTHGVGTSAAVLVANPEAIVLFVEFGETVGGEEAEHLGFLHPLVDIVTTSYGTAVPLVGIGLPLPFVNDSFESVLTLGKLHFSSAANSPDPFTPEAGGAGPWWTVSVAGIEEGSSEGRTTLSGYFTDFVGDFTQTLPYCMACEDTYNEFVGGTSFATPRSAGVASKALLEARRRMNHLGGITTVDGKPVLAAGAAGKTISAWQLRRALEDAAFTPSITDYDPLQGIFDLGALPVLPVAPWLLVGWGELSSNPVKDVVNQTLAGLGFGTLTRTKPIGTCEFQTLGIQRRMLYWNNVGLFFNTYTPPDENPYLDCE